MSMHPYRPPPHFFFFLLLVAWFIFSCSPLHAEDIDSINARDASFIFVDGSYVNISSLPYDNYIVYKSNSSTCILSFDDCYIGYCFDGNVSSLVSPAYGNTKFHIYSVVNGSIVSRMTLNSLSLLSNSNIAYLRFSSFVTSNVDVFLCNSDGSYTSNVWYHGAPDAPIDNTLPMIKDYVLSIRQFASFLIVSLFLFILYKFFRIFF